MKLRIPLFFSLICVLCTSSFAQTAKKDIIYLKNGSVINGTIIEQVPGKSYKILTSDNNTFTYTAEEIEKISTELSNAAPATSPAPIQQAAPTPTSTSEPEQKPTPKEPTFRNKGISGILRVGPLGLRSFTASAILGYQIESFLFIGAGASLDSYKNIGEFDLPYDYSGTDVLLPVFLDVRMFSSESRFAFMWHLDIGYTPVISNAVRFQNNKHSMDSYDKTTNGGTYYSTGIGLRVFASSSVAILLDFGLKIQNFTVTEYRTNYQPNYSSGYVYSTLSSTSNYKTTATPFVNIGVKF